MQNDKNDKASSSNNTDNMLDLSKVLFEDEKDSADLQWVKQMLFPHRMHLSEFVDHHKAKMEIKSIPIKIKDEDHKNELRVDDEEGIDFFLPPRRETAHKRGTSMKDIPFKALKQVFKRATEMRINNDKDEGQMAGAGGTRDTAYFAE